jgi:phage baseplate assembly protein W
MSHKENRYHPLDFEPDVAIGVMLPFNANSPGRTYDQHYSSGSMAGSTVFAQSYSTEQQAISNLKNLLLTRKGERYMQPDFGTRIFNSLFDPNTRELEDTVENTLNEDIALWLPYIILDSLDVDRRIDAHAMDIRIEFRVTEDGANQVIKLLVDENGVQLNTPY